MYFSARSASWNPLLFQHTTRCHSVFSCFSPPCPVHCRLVASDSVATREPLLVLRTSGSAPKFPISMTLFRRSEEHTSELQSRFDLVCRLLLEKKKIVIDHTYHLFR